MMYDLIVIGAGPAGIAAAYEAKKNGAKNVLLLEKAKENCQTFRIYYKDGKRVDKVYKGIDVANKGSLNFVDGTKESTLELFDNAIKQSGFEYKTSCEVEKVKKEADNYKVITSNGDFLTKYVVVAIGRMGKPNKPDYKLPSKFSKVINFNANDAKENEKILVVGGGNSAAEYAVDLSTKADVTMCYRKAEFTRLNDINLNNVKSAKINLLMATDIIEIIDNADKPKVRFTNDTIMEFDRIIYGIGGSTPVDFLNNCGIEIDDKGVPSFDKLSMQTNMQGIFVAGDIASKNGESIMMALNAAKNIADVCFKA